MTTNIAEPINEYRIADHAAFEMARRSITQEVVHRVLTAPEQRQPVRGGRDVLQSRIDFAGEIYLVRVFVDVDHKPAEVVTAYRTSNIVKYWRTES